MGIEVCAGVGAGVGKGVGKGVGNGVGCGVPADSEGAAVVGTKLPDIIGFPPGSTATSSMGSVVIKLVSYVGGCSGWSLEIISESSLADFGASLNVR